MGEAHDYEELTLQMADNDRQAVLAEQQAEAQAELDKVDAMRRAEHLSFQSGCPLKMKDIVRHKDLGEGKVVGLPDKGVEPEAHNYNKAWVHFIKDQTKLWVTWSSLKIITAQAATKRVADRELEPRTVQQKLFATSRVVRDLDAEDNLPPMASIERDRKMKMKPPAGKRGHQARGLKVTPESTISIVARMNQFPNQGFRDSFGKLFCGACSTVLHNCKSMIAAHLETKKHKGNLIKLQSRSAGDIEIMSGLNQYFIDNPQLKQRR